jgi:excisionase family DNA binding protein
MENWIPLTDAAEILGVTSEAVRRLAHRGTVAHLRMGGRLFVRKSEVERRARKVPANSRRRAS